MPAGFPFNRIGFGLHEDREMFAENDVGCERCGYVWMSIRSLRVDHRKLECPFCHACDSNFAHELQRVDAVKH